MDGKIERLELRVCFMSGIMVKERKSESSKDATILVRV
jgi:hypothetical protein